MGRKSKATSQRAHAKRRAMERYDLHFDEATRQTFVKLIRGGKTRAVRRQSLRVVIHDLEWKGTTYRVVYDTQRHEIVTFLLPDWQGVDEFAW
jgi:hypothetical protein